MNPNVAPDSNRAIRWQTYLIAFAITAVLFGTAFAANAYFDNQRTADIRATQDDISIDILSLETQFDLLADNSCTDISENSVLSTELAPLGQQLSYMESQTSIDDSELLRLKRYYSLLEIKDILLMEKVADKCNLKPVFILYFYSNAGDCSDCEQQGYVLTDLAEKYPQLRVYSFDYNLDLSALKTLISINKVRSDLPALVINGKVYSGFQSAAAIEKIIPALSAMATSTATSTGATTSTKKK